MTVKFSGDRNVVYYFDLVILNQYATIIISLYIYLLSEIQITVPLSLRNQRHYAWVLVDNSDSSIIRAEASLLFDPVIPVSSSLPVRIDRLSTKPSY